ncbi:MAG: hypothetical protein ACREIT_00645 [Tepidisphaeraceae bacterium]
MSARSLVLVAAAFSFGICSTPAILSAQDLSQPEVENARQSFAGVVNSNAVYVRSGPGENYYPTAKLDKGAPITVVGIKFEWLKIAPPQGSFCYVAKAYVEKFGDGTQGKATKPDLNVRAGSSLNAMKTTVQAKLNQGDTVTIVGEQDEYFKIAPPEGAYLYVNKQYIDPVKPIAQTPAPKPEVAEAPKAGDAAQPTDPTPAIADDGATAQAPGATGDIAGNAMADDATAAAPTTQSTGADNATAEVPASTQPTDATAGAEFDRLETAFAAASNKPIEEQALPELLAGYEKLSKTQNLPGSLLHIVDLRLTTLKVRSEAREQYLAVKKSQQEAQQRQLALKAEREELEQRIKEKDVKVFTAVGTLAASSLQQGRETLYRLTDPATGRTIVYLRTNDEKVLLLLGQFIGVRGEVVMDEQLKLSVITPTMYEPADPTKIGSRIAAQMIPPSLVPKPGPAASVEAEQ